MKYLLKSSDFRYNIDTFKFELSLTEKLRTSRALKLINIAFQLRSDITAPHCLHFAQTLLRKVHKRCINPQGLTNFRTF